MVENCIAPGTKDTYGQTYIQAHDGFPNSWGLDAYPGKNLPDSGYSGPDYRSRIGSMLDTESPDVGADGRVAGY